MRTSLSPSPEQDAEDTNPKTHTLASTHVWTQSITHIRMLGYGAKNTHTWHVVVPLGYEGQRSDQTPAGETHKPHVKRWGWAAPGTDAPRLPNHSAPFENHGRLLGEDRKPFPEFTCWAGTCPLSPFISCLGRFHLALSVFHISLYLYFCVLHLYFFCVL